MQNNAYIAPFQYESNDFVCIIYVFVDEISFIIEDLLP